MDNYILIIEVVVLIFVVLTQISFYYSTLQKINLLSNLFPETKFDISCLEKELSNTKFDNSCLENELSDKDPALIIKIKEDLYNKTFIEVIQSLNDYLIRNKGACDFSIIKSIVERSIEAKENAVNSNVSLPLYIGLMGTFVGVIIGLFKIAFGGGVTEKNINLFIGGVVIAMVASFLGLLLTVVNNSKNFKNATAVCQERKNNFFNFLQVELLPHLGNNLTDVLERLKNNINDFNDTFKTNINLFDNKFTNNISSLGASVGILSDNIGMIVENTNTQKAFLVELNGKGYNEMVKANIEVIKLLNDVSPNLLKFIESQKLLTESMANANQFVGIIEKILNRIKTFEESINKLGERINTSEFLGNEVLRRIDINLNYLDQQFELLKDHEHTSSDEIKAHFTRQYHEIQLLVYNIEKEIREALNFNIEDNPLQKLHLLEGIETSIGELNKKINFNGEFKDISDNVSTTKDDIQLIKNHLATAIEENKRSKNKIPIALKDKPITENPTHRKKPKVGFWGKIFKRENGTQ
jgi:hypothetical protein